MSTMNLKEKIIAYLKRQKMRPYQLEDKAGVSRATIYRYLKGERGMHIDSAEKILKIVG